MSWKTCSHCFLTLIALNYLLLTLPLKAQSPSNHQSLDDISYQIDQIDRLASSQPDSAFNLIQALYDVVEDRRSLVFAEILVSQGNIYFQLADYDQAIPYFSQALSIRKNHRYWEGVGNVLLNLGNVYYYLDQNDRAIKSVREAMVYYQMSKTDPLIVQEALNSLGVYYNEVGQLDSAQRYYQWCLELISLGNGTGRDSATVISNMGVLHENVGETEKALELYHKAATIERQDNNHADLAWTLHHIGIIHLESHQMDTAKVYLDQALSMARTSEQLVTEVEILQSLFYWYNEMGNLDSSTYYFDRYIDRKDKLVNIQVAKNLKYSMARIELERLNSAVTLGNERAARALAESESRQFLIILLVGALLSLCLVILFGFRFYQQKRYINQMELDVKEKQLAEWQSRAEMESLKAMLDGQERERNRIARDLHDRVGNLLATLKLSLSREGQEGKLPQVDLVDQTVKEVHNIAQDLSGDLVENYGLSLAIRELKQKVEHSAGVEMELYLDEQTDECPTTTSVELYRIIQELTANTLKHAGASKISLQTNRINGSLNLIYEDNGKGFDQEKVKEGMGTRNIKSRVEWLKATYHLDSQPGRGTIVILDLDV